MRYLDPLWYAKRLFKWLGKLMAALLLSFGGQRAERINRAKKMARVALSEMTRLKLYYKTRKGHITRIRFEDPLILTPDELWCPLRHPLPHGITTNDIRDEDRIKSLEDRLHTRVRVDMLANGKLCLVLRMKAMHWPAMFSINAFSMPADAPTLAFPLGLTDDKSHAWVDLSSIKHLLVAGATGGGKSRFLQAFIYTIASRNTHKDVELWLVDLKGQEFSRYDKIRSNRFRENIVRHLALTPEDAIDVLLEAVKEIRRRNELMGYHDVSDLEELNRVTNQHMRRIVVIIDEIAQLTLNKTKLGQYTIAQHSHQLMNDIASLGRASGVHSVIATQHITSEVLSGLILANYETRVCFSTADWRKSQIVIETSQAVGLPAGRMFYRYQGKTHEHQACYISNSQLKVELSRISRYGPYGGMGENEELLRLIKDVKLILQVSSEQFTGGCAVKKLYALPEIRDAISYNRLIELLQRLEHDGIVEKGRGNSGRRFARAFVGKPELIERFYAPEMQPNAADSDDAEYGIETPETQPNAAKRNGRQPHDDDEADVLRRSTSQSAGQPGVVFGFDGNAATCAIGGFPEAEKAQDVTPSYALLFERLVVKPKFNKMGDCRFFSVRTWRHDTKKADMKLLVEAKRTCDPAVIERVAVEISNTLKDMLKQTSIVCITHPPRGGSNEAPRHFATELAKRVADITGGTYFRAFKDRPHGMGHHPNLKNKRHPLVLENTPPCGMCVLIDDIATSGATMQECSAALGLHASIFALAWIYGEVK